jgi:hypothetical protein
VAVDLDMKFSLVSIGLAAGFAFVSPAVWAQESVGLPTSIRSEVVQGEGQNGDRFALSLSGRVSFLFGHRMEEENFDQDRYEIFDSGLGVEGDASYLWRTSRRGRLGVFVSLGWDRYGGLKTTGVSGPTSAPTLVTLVPEDLETLTFLVGPRYVIEGEHLELEMHLGIGAVHYSAVNGIVIAGGVPSDVTFFRQSAGRFVFDVGLPSLTYKIGSFGIGLGISFRFQAAPDNGDFFQGTKESPIVFGFRFGVEARF